MIPDIGFSEEPAERLSLQKISMTSLPVARQVRRHRREKPRATATDDSVPGIRDRSVTRDRNIGYPTGRRVLLRRSEVHTRLSLASLDGFTVMLRAAP